MLHELDFDFLHHRHPQKLVSQKTFKARPQSAQISLPEINAALINSLG